MAVSELVGMAPLGLSQSVFIPISEHYPNSPINYTQHGGEKTNSEDIIGICEETDTGNNTGTNMVPK
jgi:hypothetical protein